MRLKLIIVFLLMFLMPIYTVCAKNISSYVVYDMNSKSVLLGNNINDRALIASTTKILTALVALEEYDIMKEVVVEKEDTLIEGSKVYIKEGEHFTILDIVHGLLLRSGNDCANLLANEDSKGYDHFIFLMNEKCKKLGMTNSSFKNPSGLDSLDENYSTAYDMALLMSFAVKNEYFISISEKHEYRAISKEGSAYYWANKDKSVLYDERFIAGKTGYTKKCGRTLVNYAKAYSREIVIVTINDSNDFSNHRTYLNSLEKYVNYDLIKKGTYSVSNTDYIVTIKKDINIPILKSEKNNYNYVIFIGNKSYLYVYMNGLFINKYEVLIE